MSGRVSYAELEARRSATVSVMLEVRMGGHELERARELEMLHELVFRCRVCGSLLILYDGRARRALSGALQRVCTASAEERGCCGRDEAEEGVEADEGPAEEAGDAEAGSEEVEDDA